MHKGKLALTVVFAVLAVSAVSSMTASAHIFMINKAPVVGEPKFEGVSYRWLAEIKPGGLLASIRCEEDINNGQLGAEGTFHLVLEGEGCWADIIMGGKLETTQCLVTEPMVLSFTGMLTGAGEVTLTGEGAEESAGEFEFKGANCNAALKGIKIKYKGKELCTYQEASGEAVLHLLNCTPGGSKLEVKEGASVSSAKFWTEEDIKLTTNEKWSSS